MAGQYLDLSVGGVNRDYGTILSDLLRLIPQVCPEWTYQGDDDPGTAILQLLAYMADHLHYRADAAMRDLMPQTTIQASTAKAFAEWLGYTPVGRQAAVTTLRFSVSSPAAQDIIIPANTLCASADVSFETVEDTVMAAGSTYVDVSAVEGETAFVKLLGTTTGARFESFAVPDMNLIYSGLASDIRVFVGTQEAEFVRFPALAAGNELVFWVRQLVNGQYQVRFGNGKYGAVPQAGQSVTASYRIGGGVRGRVGANTVNTLASVVYYADGTQALGVSVTNTVAAQGGADPEALADIQQRAPAFFRSQDRAVTLADYEELAAAVPNVFKVKAAVSGLNAVNLFVIPEGATSPVVLTDALVSAIDNVLLYKKMATDVLYISPATLVPVDVTLGVHVRPNFKRSTVKAQVSTAFTVSTGILASDAVDLGKALRVSDMVGLLEQIPGVDYIQVHKYTRRPSLRWLTAAGNAALVGTPSTFSSTQAQVWTVTMISPTEFTVSGSVSGYSPVIGTLGSAYTVDDEITFTLAAGVTPMAAGDNGVIRVGRLAWDVEFDAFEMPEAGVISVTATGGY